MRRQIVLAIILFSCLVFVNGENGENTTSNTQMGPTDTSLGEESALEKGAKPLYDLVHGFLDSVQEYDFIADDSAKISKFLNLEEKKWKKKIKVTQKVDLHMHAFTSEIISEVI